MTGLELFPADVGRMDSPELIEARAELVRRDTWLKEHGILLHHSMACPEAPWLAVLPFTEDIGKDIGAIMAESCRLYDESGRTGYGKSDEEALADLIVRANLKHWNTP